jgi:uncharacterized protein YjlB
VKSKGAGQVTQTGWLRFHSASLTTNASTLTITAPSGIIGGMKLKITRWDQPTPPTEAELRQIYRQEGLSPYTWSNGPGDIYPAHTHAYHKVLYVMRGSITWELPEIGQQIETFPGDRIDLPSGTLHAARVGPQGVTCLEAHLA